MSNAIVNSPIGPVHGGNGERSAATLAWVWSPTAPRRAARSSCR